MHCLQRFSTHGVLDKRCSSLCVMGELQWRVETAASCDFASRSRHCAQRSRSEQHCRPIGSKPRDAWEPLESSSGICNAAIKHYAALSMKLSPLSHTCHMPNGKTEPWRKPFARKNRLEWDCKKS